MCRRNRGCTQQTILPTNNRETAMTPFLAPAEPAEAWRPRLHYSARGNWINDPNGLFYQDGVYHLYYQMNPDDSVWGNMHWGHAVSRDLLH